MLRAITCVWGGGEVLHPVCADSRESCCWSVCVQVAAGSQVGRQCQRCVKHTHAVVSDLSVSHPAPHRTTEVSYIIWLQMNIFVCVLAKVVFDELLTWWLIFASDLLSSEIKKEWSFPCEASCWRAPRSNSTHKTFINRYKGLTLFSQSNIKRKTLKVESGPYLNNRQTKSTDMAF